MTVIRAELLIDSEVRSLSIVPISFRKDFKKSIGLNE